MKEKEKENQEIDSFDEFNFEVSSTNETREFITEINDLKDELESKTPKQRTIKIISERDIQYKEAPPPNFSPYFKCILHFKDSDYKNRITLEVAKKYE